MTNRDELAAFLEEEAASDPAFRDALQDARQRHDILAECIARRKHDRLTQRAVAEAMETTQSAVSELESGATDDPRLSTLQRYARAIGCRIELKLTSTAATPAFVWGATAWTPNSVSEPWPEWNLENAAVWTTLANIAVNISVPEPSGPTAGYQQQRAHLSLVTDPAA